MDSQKIVITAVQGSRYNNNWTIIKEYINSQKINTIIPIIESELLKTKKIEQTHTIQFYYSHLENISVLQGNNTHFKILRKIPDDLGVYELFNLSKLYENNKWLTWFTSLEDNLVNLREEG